MINNNKLVVSAWPYGKKVFNLDTLEKVSIIDLDKTSEFSPVWRTFGMSLGSYHIGKYKLNSDVVGLMIVNKDKPVVLKEKDKVAIITPKRQEAFIRELQEKGVNIDQ